MLKLFSKLDVGSPTTRKIRRRIIMQHSERIPRYADAQVAVVQPGAANLSDFELELDTDGAHLPGRHIIRRIIIHPSASTQATYRIFSGTSREIDPTNADYNLIWESADGAASADVRQFEVELPYIDEDSGGYLDMSGVEAGWQGEIFMQIEVAVNAAAFAVRVGFTEE